MKRWKTAQKRENEGSNQVDVTTVKADVKKKEKLNNSEGGISTNGNKSYLVPAGDKELLVQGDISFTWNP